MGICLNMIVRNESKNLPRLFASLQGQVDYYVISDTGSTDDTIDVIHALGARYGIPGEVTEHSWVDFAHNRNRVMEDAVASREAGRHQCQWLMIIDADEEFVCDNPNWSAALAEGTSYYVYRKTSYNAWANLFLVWIPGQSWKWTGSVHNYLVNAIPGHPKQFLLDVYVRYHLFEGAKSHGFRDQSHKAQSDAQQLEEELKGRHLCTENAHRFYQWAYSLFHAGDIEGAYRIMKQVVDSGHGSVARKYSARIFLAECLGRLNDVNGNAFRLLDEAIRLDPQRREAMYYKALLLRKYGDPDEARRLLEQAAALPWPKQGYFMWEESVYTWKIDYELAFLYYYRGAFEAAAEKIRQLKAAAYLPDAESAFLLALEKRMPVK
jgi:glycosyltransferase involved in cell wall biosynthesis